ncbi:hypothetical protein B4129_1788 [Bacillus safensis]|nr:hypothetical protein B4129_1788 [Bacillus safensis]MBW0259582.1 hypothetical protein [Bacillus sp. F2HM]
MAIIRRTAAGFGAQAFYGLWSSELFHTKYRAKAQGFLFCTARVAVGLISLVIPTMISTFMIGFLVIAAIIGLVMAPETRRKSLKEIEKERYSA